MRVITPYGRTEIYSAKSHNPATERILVVPGFSEMIAHNQGVVDALAAKGFDAMTFNQPRHAGKDAHRVKDPIQRQGNVVLRIIEAALPAGEKVHAVAHSLGSAAVLRAAQKSPERFASIILMQPLGMVGEQSIRELAGRAGNKIIKNHTDALRSQPPGKYSIDGYAAHVDIEPAARYAARVTRAQLAASKLLAIQPVLAIKEALAAGRYEIAPDIAKVTNLDIPVHLVTAHNDEMFDSDKVHTGYEETGIVAASYSNVADPGARHDTFWLQPERTAVLVGQLLPRNKEGF